MKNTKKTKSYSCCTMNKCKMESVEVQSRLIKKAIKSSKSLKKPTYQKLIQIMAFCNTYLSQSDLYARLAEAHYESVRCADQENKQRFEDLFASVLNN